jgi:hypothetical protein
MSNLVDAVTGRSDYAGSTPLAQAWFAGGELVGHDPNAHGVIPVKGAPPLIARFKPRSQPTAAQALACVRPHLGLD